MICTASRKSSKKALSAERKRELVRFLEDELSFSERRACKAIGVNRSTSRYVSRGGDPKALVQKVREVANRHPSYGYRRVHRMLARAGVEMNVKKLRRIYLRESLVVRRRRRPRRIHGQGKSLPPIIPKKPLDLWAMDFMYDSTLSGRGMKILTVIDHFSRYCPGILIRAGFSALELCKVLDHLIAIEGKPNAIISDNGTEFTAREFRAWADSNGIKLFYIKPGRPTENGMIESFNGRVRDECLNQTVFTSIEDAGDIVEKWRLHYNEERPHSSLGNLSPMEYVRQLKLLNGQK